MQQSSRDVKNAMTTMSDDNRCQVTVQVPLTDRYRYCPDTCTHISTTILNIQHVTPQTTV